MRPELLEMLRDFQRAPTEHLVNVLKRYNTAVDMSGTGTGKTYMAVAAAAELKLPTVIVVPKISITSWNRVSEYFNDQFSIINYEMLRTGNTSFGQWEHQDAEPSVRYVCEFCQQQVNPDNPSECYTNTAGVHCVNTKKIAARKGGFKFHPAVRMVIFDEAHRCGGIDSDNAELLLAAKRQNLKTHLMSATLACDPMKFRAIGYALDLHSDKNDEIRIQPSGAGMNFKWEKFLRPNFYRWLYQHGCRRIPPMPGIRWAVGREKQLQIMAAIRSRLVPERGIRLTVDEIPGFPECDISAELYDIDQCNEVNNLYEDMREALNQLEIAKSNDKAPDHPLTRILRARQQIELLKVPIAVELVNDALEKGLSVGVFVNFRPTILELSKRLNCKDIIDGSPEGIRNRQAIIDGFQSDEKRLFLANSEAGGISFSGHDIRGEFPRIGYVMPGFSATTMLQVFGRFRRDGGKSKSFYRVLLAANTVETSVYRNFRNKMNNLDALVDGDLVPRNFPVEKMSRIPHY